jgi:hypothetical protein
VFFGELGEETGLCPGPREFWRRNGFRELGFDPGPRVFLESSGAEIGKCPSKF